MHAPGSSTLLMVFTLFLGLTLSFAIRLIAKKLWKSYIWEDLLFYYGNRYGVFIDWYPHFFKSFHILIYLNKFLFNFEKHVLNSN